LTDCAEARDLVEKLSDGEVTAAERRTAEAHLEKCPSCRGHFEFLVSLSREARAMSLAEPPESYWEHLPRRVLDRIDSGRRRPSGIGAILLGPSMLRFLPLGATLLVVTAVSLFVLRERSRMEEPRPAIPAAASEAPEAEAELPAEPASPPPMARDEAAPRRSKLEPESVSSEDEATAREAPPPAARSESANAVVENEVTEARDPALGKENVQGLESANRPRAAPAPATLSRIVAPESCEALRRTVASLGDGPGGNDARYDLATCSLERQERERTEELRKLALEDAEAFLGRESDGARAEEIREKLRRIERP
jgi:hypothetical protein